MLSLPLVSSEIHLSSVVMFMVQQCHHIFGLISDNNRLIQGNHEGQWCLMEPAKLPCYVSFSNLQKILLH